MTISQPTILIVDDEEANLYVRRRILRQAGFATIEASNGRECLRLVASLRPALVLLDMNLPDISGAEVCRQIKQSMASAPVFVLHISAALISSQHRTLALNDGADGYLVEPVEPEELIATVRAMLRLQQAEEQLRQANSRFERAERAANGFAFEVDLVGGQVVRSPNFTHITGYTLEEIPPTTTGWTDLIHPDDVAAFARRDLVAAEETAYMNDYRVRHKAGHYFWVQEQGLLERDATGQPVAIVGTTVDITERKIAEQQLHFQAKLLDYAHDAVIATDPQQIVTLWNRGAEQLLGWQADEVVGRPAREAIPSTFTDEQRRRAAELLATTGIYRDEETLFHRSGTPVITHAVNVTLRDDKGQITGYLAINRDITERKQTEERLRQSEERYRTLFETMDQGYCVFAVIFDAANQPLDYRFLEVNPAFASLTGLENAVGKTARELVPDLEAHWFAIYGEVALTGEAQRFEQGSAAMGRWFEVYAFRVGGAESRKVGVLFTNITERKQAEEEIQRSRSLLQHMAEASPDEISVYNLREQRMIYHNRRSGMADFSGRAYWETTPAEIDSHIHPADVERVQQEFARLYSAADGEVVETTFRWRQPAGDYRWLQERTVVFARDEQGTVTQHLSITSDITERKQAEERVRISEAQLNTVLQNIPASIYMLTPDQRYLYVNRHYEQLAHITNAEIQGKSIYEMFSPDIAAALAANDLRALAAKAPIELEEFALQDGEWHTYTSIKAPLLDAAGEPYALLGISTDITERRRAEQNQQFLSDLSMRLQVLSDPAQIQQTVVDQLGQYLGVSRCRFNAIDLAADRAERLAEWLAPGEAPTSDIFPFSEYAAPAYIAHAQAGQTLVIADAYQDERTELAQALLRKYGSPATIRVPCIRQGQWVASLHVLHSTPRQWRADEVQLVENVAHHFWPLVEKARAEAALRQQEKFVRQIADNVPGLIGYLGADERYRFVNQTFEEWFQRPQRKIVGHTVMDLIGSEEHARLRDYRQRALAGEIITYEEPFAYPDGVLRTTWARYQPDIAPDGSVLGFYIFVMDISERKAAELALQQNNAILRGVLESSTDAIFVRDLAGRYLLVNATAAEQVQISQAAMIGKRYEELFTPREVSAIQQDDHPVFELGQSVTLEHITQQQGVTRYWHTVKTPLRNAAGEIIGLISSARDISERKRTELHQQFLAELFAQLRLLNQTDLMFEQLVSSLGEYLAVSSCRINAIDLTQAEFIVQRNWGGNGVRIGQSYPLDELAPPAILAALQAGETVVVTNTASDPRTALVMAAYDEDQVSAFIGVPIFYQGEWQATLSVKAQGERHWRADEAHLLETVAGQFGALLEKARAEETLRSSEERLRLALEGGNLAVFEHNLALNLVRRSASALHIQGLGEYGDGSEQLHYLHPLDRSAFIRAVEAITPQRPNYECEYRLRRPDTGQQVWLLERGQGFFSEQGELQRIVGAVMDIGERKQREAEGRFLSELSEVMAHTQAMEELLWNVARHLAEFLDVARSFFVERDPTQEAVIVHRNYYQPGLSSLEGVYFVADFDPESLAAQAGGRTVTVADTHSPLVQARDNQSRYEAMGIRALVAAPLLRTGQWAATLLVIDNQPRQWSEAEVRLIQTVAERAWLAVENRRLLAESQEKQRFLQSIADTTPNLLYLFDLRTQANRYANRQMIQMLGYTPSEIQAQGGNVLQQLMHPADLAYLAEHQQHLRQLGNGEVAEWEYRLRHQDGAWHWLGSRETVFERDATGEPAVILGAVQDITDRKTTEIELRSSEARYRHLADAMPQIVWRTQINGVVDYLNQQWFHYTGLTAEASYADPNQVIHPDDTAVAVAAWQQAQLDGAAYEYEMRLRRFDGDYRWFLVRTVPVHNDSGEVINWYGSSTDITELKQVQEDLSQLNITLEQRVQERTAELERSNRELDKFAYVASHDLKSPLRAIENLAHWVDEDAGGLLPEAAKGHLARLQGRVKRMERLLDDLLAYSRAGRYQYNLEKINLQTVVQDTLDLLAPPAEFQFTLDIQAPIYIGQRAPLETVLRNLISNAIKHHDRPDGHIWVTVQDRKEQIEISVRDDGPGIDPKFHDKVFEMFQTLQPRDKVEGSGIGLAIVKKLIESLGGTISLASAEGAGATFHVLWPKK